jgi:hypothetical protein
MKSPFDSLQIGTKQSLERQTSYEAYNVCLMINVIKYKSITQLFDSAINKQTYRVWVIQLS